jgi:hypothetical protein
MVDRDFLVVYSTKRKAKMIEPQMSPIFTDRYTIRLTHYPKNVRVCFSCVHLNLCQKRHQFEVKSGNFIPTPY